VNVTLISFWILVKENLTGDRTALDVVRWKPLGRSRGAKRPESPARALSARAVPRARISRAATASAPRASISQR